jgi:YD repeat-containing protein
VNGTRTNYTYNAVNELTKACIIPNGSNCSASTVYSYDARGNLLTQNSTSTNTNWTYSGNPSGQLTKVTNNAGTQGTYAYDANGRRVESQEASTTTFCSYSGTNVIFQQVSSGALTDFIFASGILIAKVVLGSSINYYCGDALGSTRLVSDANGNTVFSDGYQPFGQDNGRPTGSETYKFTGKPVSQTTGLYYVHQRRHDPSVGGS